MRTVLRVRRDLKDGLAAPFFEGFLDFVAALFVDFLAAFLADFFAGFFADFFAGFFAADFRLTFFEDFFEARWLDVFVELFFEVRFRVDRFEDFAALAIARRISGDLIATKVTASSSTSSEKSITEGPTRIAPGIVGIFDFFFLVAMVQSP